MRGNDTVIAEFNEALGEVAAIKPPERGSATSGGSCPTFRTPTSASPCRMCSGRIDERDRQILDIGHRVHAEVDGDRHQQAHECGGFEAGSGRLHSSPAEDERQERGVGDRGRDHPGSFDRLLVDARRRSLTVHVEDLLPEVLCHHSLKKSRVSGSTPAAGGSYVGGLEHALRQSGPPPGGSTQTDPLTTERERTAGLGVSGTIGASGRQVGGARTRRGAV